MVIGPDPTLLVLRTMVDASSLSPITTTTATLELERHQDVQEGSKIKDAVVVLVPTSPPPTTATRTTTTTPQAESTTTELTANEDESERTDVATVSASAPTTGTLPQAESTERKPTTASDLEKGVRTEDAVIDATSAPTTTTATTTPRAEDTTGTTTPSPPTTTTTTTEGELSSSLSSLSSRKGIGFLGLCDSRRASVIWNSVGVFWCGVMALGQALETNLVEVILWLMGCVVFLWAYWGALKHNVWWILGSLVYAAVCLGQSVALFQQDNNNKDASSFSSLSTTMLVSNPLVQILNVAIMFLVLCSNGIYIIEIQRGIMTRENYRNERFCCSCQNRRRRRTSPGDDNGIV